MKLKASMGSIGFAFILVLSFLAGTLVAPTAHAATYNRTAAAAYAKKYACNNNTSCRNAAYVSFGSDCTNFVSQVLKAGGMAEVKSGYPYWVYYNSSVYSKSWSSVKYFLEFWREAGKGRTTATDYTNKMGNAYTNASYGDVYVYDWGRGDGWSHLSVSTASGTFGTYLDPKTGKRYSSVTGGTGDKIAQHSTDRDGAPWNWGYHTETSAVVKGKMRTMVLHISS